MVSQTAFQLTLDFLTSKPVVVVPSTDQVSSDAGLLPFRQLDEQLGLTRQVAEALTDRRHAGYVNHSFLEMTRMRVYGILADYADQNDHRRAAQRSDLQTALRPFHRRRRPGKPADHSAVRERHRSGSSSASATCCSTSSSPPSRSRRGS